MASSQMADIELASIDVRKEPEFPLIRQRTRLQEDSEYVNTQFGKVLVTIQGDRTKPAFVTYHDLGLNSVTQFHGFFNFSDMEPIMESFCAYHINAPGQEEGAHQLPPGTVYPTMDELADTVATVIAHFKITDFVVFGIGLGANVLARFALNYPEKPAGIILMNCVASKCGWIEWGYQKWNNWYLGSGQFTAFTQNYLLWHHFGYKTWETNHDLITTYSNILTKGINPYNLSLLINSYIARTDLGIQRQDIDTEQQISKAKLTLIKTFNFRCPVLNILGDSSPHEDDVVETNGRLNPTNSSFVKFSDCGGMVLEEQPGKMSESLRYFLQGLGYLTHLSITRYSLANRLREQAIRQKRTVTSKSIAYASDNNDMQTMPDSFSGIDEEPKPQQQQQAQ